MDEGSRHCQPAGFYEYFYMADLAELMAMNEVFSQYFPVDPPARTTFQCAALVGGARVGIEAIGYV